MTASDERVQQQLEKTAMLQQMTATQGKPTATTSNLLDKQQETTAVMSTNSNTRRDNSNVMRNTSK